MSETTANLAALLDHRDWLRRLARALVIDEARADDIVQETWLAAVRHSPSPASPRGWLATVARNAARKLARSRRARDRRERAAAKPESLPSTAEIAARVESQRRVARALLAIDEPFRTALLLRYHEGLEPAEIAARQGVPGSTVRNRIRRGLDRLREALDREHEGDRRAWVLPLLPLLASRPRVGVHAAAGVTGVLLMSLKTKLALVALFLAAVGAAGWVTLSPPAGPPTAPRADAGDRGTEPGGTPRPEAAARETAGETAAGAVPEVEGPAGDVRVTTNVPGARVTLTLEYYGGEDDPEPMETTADANGAAGFVLPAHPEPLFRATVTASADGHPSSSVTVRDGKADLSLWRSVALVGRVTDLRGQPVEGAEIHVENHVRTRTAADGSFAVCLPREGDLTLTIEHPSYLTARVPTRAPCEGLAVRLDPGLSVSGRVTSSDGTPLVRAKVRGRQFPATGRHREVVTYSGADGAYVLTGFTPGDVSVTGCDYLVLGAKAGDAGVDFRIWSSKIVNVRAVDSLGRVFRHANLLVVGKHATALGRGDRPGGVPVLVQYGRPFQVTAVAPGYPPTEHRVETEPLASGSTVDVVLRRGEAPAALEIRARDDRGDALGRLYVTLLAARGSLIPGLRNLRVPLDESGRGRIADLPPGRYLASISTAGYSASADGYGLPVHREVVLEAGNTAMLEDVTVPIGGRVRATVRDPSGGTPGVNGIRIIDAKGRRNRRELGQDVGLDRAGSGWITKPALTPLPVPVGDYVVEAVRGRKVVARAEVRVLRGETVDVELMLAE